MISSDCSKYEGMEKIEASVGGRYEDVFVSDRKSILKIKEEIKGLVDVNDDAIDCFIYEKLSLGKLTPFLMDGNLEEIMVIKNGLPVYIFDRDAGMTRTNVFLGTDETTKAIKKIARYSGRTINSSHPLLDGHLPDGSRANATVQKVTPGGPTLTIRKFAEETFSILDLIRYRTMTPELAAFLWLVVEGLETKPANLLIVGEAACGKTTTLNALTQLIPLDKRIISIEDTLEIKLRHRNWVPTEIRSPYPGKENKIVMDDVLKNTLMMRPDRILVGEVRSREALTLFSAMNTGHSGCMATIHANSAKGALVRLQTHPMNVPNTMLSALDLIIVQANRLEDGKFLRRVVEVAEISGSEGKTILTNNLFKFDPAKRKLKINLLNGRIIQELSKLSNLTIREIYVELYRRKAILDAMAKNRMNKNSLYEVVNMYYKKPEDTMEMLCEKLKAGQS